MPFWKRGLPKEPQEVVQPEVKRLAAVPIDSQAARIILHKLTDGSRALENEYHFFTECQPDFAEFCGVVLNAAGVTERSGFEHGLGLAHALLGRASTREVSRFGLGYYNGARKLPPIGKPVIETIYSRIQTLGEVNPQTLPDVCAPEFAPGIICGLYEHVAEHARTEDRRVQPDLMAGAALLGCGVELAAQLMDAPRL